MTTLESTTRKGYKVSITVDYDVDNPHDSDYAAKLVLHGGRNYIFPNDAGIDFGEFEGWAGVADELAKRHGAILLTPVWVYEHSGIALKAGARTYPFDDRWDSAQVGFAYITQETYQNVTGKRYVGRPSQYKRAAELIQTEVETYGRWVNGECYGFVIEDAEGEFIDSCGGYIGYEAVEAAANDVIDNL